MAEIDESDRRAARLVGRLGAEQLNWRPVSTAWSIGQCLEHLVAGSDLYLPAITKALGDQRPGRVAEVTAGYFSRHFIQRYIAASPGARRARAPGKIQPPSHVEPSVLDRFLRSNEAARDLIVRASEYDVNRIRFRNPFIPLIRFTVGTGLEIVSKHQGRHLLQAERVRQSDGFPL
jgi:hypothetical protein